MRIEDVVKWLCENRCPMTSIELYHEWKSVHNETHISLLDVAFSALRSAEGSTPFNNDAVGNNLEQAVVEMIVTYGKMNGDGNNGAATAIKRVFKKAMMHISPDLLNTQLTKKDCDYDNFFLIRGDRSGGDGGIDSDDKTGGEIVGNKKTEGNEKSEDEKSRLLSSLQTKLQLAEQNLSTAMNTISEQLPTLVGIVDPMQKDVLIPIITLIATLSEAKITRADARLRLLTLYNRPNREHRAAIAEGWAMMLRHSPPSVLEHDVVPELYTLVNARSTERRVLALECVACLAPILQKDHYTIRSVICQGFLRQLSDDETQTVRFHVLRCLVELWPEVKNDSFLQSEGGIIGKDTEKGEESVLCFVELFVNIILHDSSSKVRRCALQSLRDCLCQTTFTPRHLLVGRIITLLLSFIERESVVMNCDKKAVVVGEENEEEHFFSSLGVNNNDNAVEKSVSRNISILANLIEYPLCSAWKGISNSEKDVFSVGVDLLMFDAYLCVVLPSAYGFVLVNQEEDVLATSICAVASALASIVPMLDMDKWQCVRNSLEVFLAKNNCHFNSSVGISCSAGWRRRQLCFFFTFLMCVCGAKNFFKDNTSDGVFAIAKDAAMLLGTTLAADVEDNLDKNMSEKEKGGDKMLTQLTATARFNACASCLIWLATRADDEEGKSAAAVSSVLTFLTESPSVKHKLIAIALVERVSRFAKDDQMREERIWPALVALMNHTRYDVKEAAIKAALSIVKYITNPMAQEKVMKTALSIFEMEGCISRFGVGILHHWSSLLREMPAEPRELFLYPQLATMIEQLSGLLLLLQRKPEGNVFTTVVPAGKGACTSHPVSKEVVNEALEAVISLLAAIPHCAVVTPQLVKKHLAPAIRLLTSIQSLSASTRTQLLNIEKEYNQLLGPSKGLGSTFDLFDRIRYKIKK